MEKLALTLAAETLDLAVGSDLVVLEDGHLDLFPLVLDLLGGGLGVSAARSPISCPAAKVMAW